METLLKLLKDVAGSDVANLRMLMIPTIKKILINSQKVQRNQAKRIAMDRLNGNDVSRTIQFPVSS